MKTEELIIDCDGHILEPPDLWEKYIDPKYRDRAMRIRVGDDGFEYLEIDRKRAKMTAPGLLGSLGGMGKKVEDARKLRESAMRGDAKPEQVRMLAPKPENTYLKGAAFGTMVMKERLELLNKEAEILGVSDHLAQELPTLIALVCQGRLDLASVVTRTVPLAAEPINEALDRLEQFGEDVRVVVAP